MTAAAHIDREELMAWRDHEVRPVRALEIESHVGACVTCRVDADAEDALAARLSAWTIPPAPASLTMPRAPRGFWARAVDWRRWTWRGWLVPIAGAAVILLVAIDRPRRAAPAAEDERQRAAVAGQSAALRDTFDGNVGSVEGIARKPITMPEVDRDRAPQPAPSDAPLVVRTAQIEITVDAFDSLRGRLEALTRESAGAVTELRIGGLLPNRRVLSATVRVPSDRLDATLKQLRALGEVGDESESSADITSAHRDLAIRIANARIEEQRLGALMAQRTGSVKDVLEVERELARVRTEIEQMAADERGMRDRVALSTITVHANERYRAELGAGAPVSLGTRLSNAFVDGVRDARDGLIDVAESMLLMGPTLALWATAIGPIVWLLRRRYRRRGAR